MATTAAHDMLAQVHGRFGTILADPPWRFQNRTGKMAPEHQRLMRYSTLDFEEIYQLPVGELAAEERADAAAGLLPTPGFRDRRSLGPDAQDLAGVRVLPQVSPLRRDRNAAESGRAGDGRQ